MTTKKKNKTHSTGSVTKDSKPTAGSSTKAPEPIKSRLQGAFELAAARFQRLEAYMQLVRNMTYEIVDPRLQDDQTRNEFLRVQEHVRRAHSRAERDMLRLGMAAMQLDEHASFPEMLEAATAYTGEGYAVSHYLNTFGHYQTVNRDDEEKLRAEFKEVQEQIEDANDRAHWCKKYLSWEEAQWFSRPEDAGFYFYRAGPTEQPVPMEVRVVTDEEDNYLEARPFNEPWELLSSYEGQWAEPIAPSFD